MSKCFISYTHKSEVDKHLACFIDNYLTQHGHEVFIDYKITPGKRWPEEIERQLNNSEFFIVLLSPISILSDMIREEVERAHRLMKDKEGKFMILPIRVDFIGELPLHLGAWLNPLQYALWKSTESFETIAERVLETIEKKVLLPLKWNSGNTNKEFSVSGIQNLHEITDAIGAPLLAADPRLRGEIELETGTLKLDSRYYVRRKADGVLLKQIFKKGSTTIVKGSRQTGKSSLLIRAHASAKKYGLKSYYLDFQYLDNSQLKDLETLLKALACSLSEELKTEIKPEDCWRDSIGSKGNFTEFIEKVLLEKSQEQVLIIFDEADRVFGFPYRDDFFSCIRCWHNRRAEKEEYWRGLNLVISHSTESYLFIRDSNLSPFNVGEKIRMENFESPQVNELNEIHGMPLKTDADIHELLSLTGGHPFLVRLALYTLKSENYSLSQLKKTALEDSGPFGDHLRHFVWRLHQEKELKKSLRQVLRKGKCKDESHFLRLRAAGLVSGESHHRAKMGCKLYYDYFRRYL